MATLMTEALHLSLIITYKDETLKHLKENEEIVDITSDDGDLTEEEQKETQWQCFC